MCQSTPGTLETVSVTEIPEGFAVGEIRVSTVVPPRPRTNVEGHRVPLNVSIFSIGAELKVSWASVP